MAYTIDSQAKMVAISDQVRMDVQNGLYSESVAKAIMANATAEFTASQTGGSGSGYVAQPSPGTPIGEVASTSAGSAQMTLRTPEEISADLVAGGDVAKAYEELVKWFKAAANPNPEATAAAWITDKKFTGGIQFNLPTSDTPETQAAIAAINQGMPDVGSMPDTSSLFGTGGGISDPNFRLGAGLLGDDWTGGLAPAGNMGMGEEFKFLGGGAGGSGDPGTVPPDAKWLAEQAALETLPIAFQQFYSTMEPQFPSSVSPSLGEFLQPRALAAYRLFPFLFPGMGNRAMESGKSPMFSDLFGGQASPFGNLPSAQDINQAFLSSMNPGTDAGPMQQNWGKNMFGGPEGNALTLATIAAPFLGGFGGPMGNVLDKYFSQQFSRFEEENRGLSLYDALQSGKAPNAFYGLPGFGSRSPAPFRWF